MKKKFWNNIVGNSSNCLFEKKALNLVLLRFQKSFLGNRKT